MKSSAVRFLEEERFQILEQQLQIGEKKRKKIKQDLKEGARVEEDGLQQATMKLLFPPQACTHSGCHQKGEIMTNSIRTIPYIWNILDLLSWMNPIMQGAFRESLKYANWECEWVNGNFYHKLSNH